LVGGSTLEHGRPKLLAILHLRSRPAPSGHGSDRIAPPGTPLIKLRLKVGKNIRCR
jgi:hypothetical protein